MITCPRCNTDMGMKIIKGKRPGWECLGCGIFFARQTWEVRDGTLVRKYPTKPSYTGYVNAKALKKRVPSVKKKDLEWPADGPDEEIADLIDEGWI